MIDNMVISALARFEPELYFLYKKLDIEFVKDETLTSSTDGRKLWIGHKFYQRGWIGQYFLLVHELLHVVYDHPKRILIWGDKFRKKFNKMADAKINYLIIKAYPKARNYILDYTKWIDLRDLELLSVEELMYKYEGVSFPVKDEMDIVPSSFTIDGRFVHSLEIGDYRGRLFRNLNPKKFDWIYDLNLAILNVEKQLLKIVSQGEPFSDTFGLPSRRVGLPSYRMVNKVSKSMLIDVSGSISDWLIDKFASISYYIDVDEYLYFDYGLVHYSCVPSKRVMGGGGTKILPALEKAKGDLVIVLSDGKWEDKNEAIDFVKNNSDRNFILISPKLCVDGFICLNFIN